MIWRLLVSSAFVLATLVLVPTGAPGVHGQEPIGYRDVSPEELHQLLAEVDPFVIDVHVPNEGRLAATDARIPYTEVADHVTELPPDPESVIVVYCMSGRMSEIAATQLASMGYHNVLNLAGGMIAWQAAGYELLSD